MNRETKPPSRRLTKALLWVLAVVLMLSAAVYQRLTGPTHPRRVEIAAGGDVYKARLPRSGLSTEDLRIAVPDLGPGSGGRVVYKRYRTSDAPAAAPLERQASDDGRELVAHLPRQPSAGKLEYHLELLTPDGPRRVPEAEGETIVMRFRDQVPTPLLLAHVLTMFIAMLIGLRAALAAVAGLHDMRPLSWTCFAGITVGGMVLGPFVQKHAFGEYWTGFPWGYDLTDNKTLIMWLAWLAASALLVWGPRGKEGQKRAAVLAAAVVMIVVYLIPHSLRGSELDYSQVDQGVDPAEAIGTAED